MQVNLSILGFTLIVVLATTYSYVLCSSSTSSTLNSTKTEAVNETSHDWNSKWELINNEELCSWCQAIIGTFKERIRDDKKAFAAVTIMGIRH